jgi:DNA-binding transcriptional LysR family regulator
MPAPITSARLWGLVMRTVVTTASHLVRSSFAMVDLTPVNISALDLNLFLVFQAVLEEGTTVRAAARLGVTQSAVSNALARLRHAVGDPLFVRSGRGLVPTPRAEELRPAVAEAIRRLEEALGQTFDPGSTRRTFTLACADHHQAADVPKVARAFAAALPSACLRIVSIDYLIASDGLARGTVDAVLAPEGTEGPDLHAEPLFREGPVLVVRRDHPEVGRSLTAEQLGALGHIDVHITLGEPGDVNRAVSAGLSEHGLARSIALVVPSFTAAAMVAASTDYVAWLPDHAARLYTSILPLRAVKAPLPPMDVACVLLWHERTHADAGASFFRALVARELREALPRRPRRSRAAG